MAITPVPLLPSSRGTMLFSSDALQKVFNETVAPEVDESHSIVAVGTVTADGAQAAVVFSRPVTIGSLHGEWQAEAAIKCNWQGEHDEEAKILFKL
jgi:hypothetical protein